MDGQSVSLVAAQAEAYSSVKHVASVDRPAHPDPDLGDICCDPLSVSQYNDIMNKSH